MIERASRVLTLVLAVVLVACGGRSPPPVEQPTLPDDGGGESGPTSSTPPPAPTLADRLAVYCNLPKLVAPELTGVEREKAMAAIFADKVESAEITDLMKRLADGVKTEPELAAKIRAEVESHKIMSCAMLDEYVAVLAQREVDHAAAAKLLQEAITAKTGTAGKAAPSSYRIHASGTLTTKSGTVRSKHVRVYVAPDKTTSTPVMWREDMTLGDIQLIMAVANHVGWRSKKGKSSKAEITDVGDQDEVPVLLDLTHDPELVLWSSLEGPKLATLPDEDIGGKPQLPVRITYAEIEVKLYLDKVTKLITRIESFIGETHAVEDLSDYRKVGGTLVAHKRKTTDDVAGSALELQLDKVALDPKVDRKIFNRPR